jgi:hypothetical protein
MIRSTIREAAHLLIGVSMALHMGSILDLSFADFAFTVMIDKAPQVVEIMMAICTLLVDRKI